jgi:hypothetical protein
MSQSEVDRVHRAIDELARSLKSLVDRMDGDLRVHGTRRGAPREAAVPVERRAKIRRSAKKYWASLTPEQHKARVRKMLAGRGLKPKRKSASSG